MDRGIYENGDYLAKNAAWHVEDSPWKAAQIAKMMKSHGISPRSICEIGCGAGRVLFELSKAAPGPIYSGFDPSADAARFWHGLPNHLALHNTDFRSTTDIYDLVLVVDVIEHIPDYIGFLREVLPRGRRHIFHIPLEMNAQGVLRNVQMASRRQVGHLHYFSRDTALAALEDAGYRVIDSVYTPAAIDRAPSWKPRLLNIARVPLFRLWPDATARLLGGWSLLALTEPLTSP